jgi:hypothetical protein
LFAPVTPPAARADIAPRPVNNRAKVSNGTRLLANIDGRSVEGRRYRDLTIAFADGAGGIDSLSEVERAVVRQAAASVVASEKINAAIIRGENIDIEQATRLSNATSRLLKQLGAMTRKPLATVKDNIARRYPAARLPEDAGA